MEFIVVLFISIVLSLHGGVFCDPVVSTTPSVTLTEGSRASLPCRVVPQSLLLVQWSKKEGTDVSLLIHLKKAQNEQEDDEKIGRGYDAGHFDMDESYSLIIKNVSKSDEGRYICEILEAVTFNFFDNHTDVTVPGERLQYVEGAPCLSKSVPPSAVFLTEDSSACIPCPVTTRNVLMVTWLKGTSITTARPVIRLSKRLGVEQRTLGSGYEEEERRVDIDGSFTLIIDPVKKLDRGKYFCEVIEAETELLLYNHIDVTVHDKPYLFIKGCGDQTDCSMTVPRDEDNILLHCSIIGAMGSVHLYWTKNGSDDGIISRTEARSEIPSNYSLAIRKEKEDIQNRLSFTCIAKATREYDTIRSTVIMYLDPNSGYPFTTSTSYSDSQADNVGQWIAVTVIFALVIISSAVLFYCILPLKDLIKRLLEIGNEEEMQDMIKQNIEYNPTPHMRELFYKHALGRYLQPWQSAATPTHPQSMKYNDHIHGTIIMPPYCQVIINTPEFQRLRDIKQLSCTSFIYPTAVHTKFHHSIGVSHLAGDHINYLQRDASNGISELDVACVQIAGLCHDLGHLPFSHDFQRLVRENPKRSEWKHVDASVEIFKHLIKKNKLELDLQLFGLENSHINFICDLILGGSDDPIPGDRFFLYQIVNNRVTGVDVDRWDYLKRDSHFLGLLRPDIDRIFEHTKVIKVQRESGTRKEICYKEEVKGYINNLFVARRNLHTNVYRNRATSAFSLMMIDTLREASDGLKYTGDDGKVSLLEAVGDLSAFCKLNDRVLQDIVQSQSSEKGMKKAQKIIDRMNKGHLYQLIMDVDNKCEPNTLDKGDILERIGENITNYRQESNGEINQEIWRLENIAVEVCEFDLGHGGKNPFDFIPFLVEEGGKGNKKYKFLSTDKMPTDLPQTFHTVTVRIFSRVPAEEYRITEKDRAMFNKLLTDALDGKKRTGQLTPQEGHSAVSIEMDDQETPETQNLVSNS